MDNILLMFLLKPVVLSKKYFFDDVFYFYFYQYCKTKKYLRENKILSFVWHINF